ncbi:unnamed protein product [Callosobruchus maculatus]|uniref:Uncharacterized protein n=1 Tax=Callosobruchus maculatus TaxID=64391 RepID=A0A653C8S9_CALMS|nr:unnamed protein product [Callosobruchus maculatus]
MPKYGSFSDYPDINV